MERIKTPRQFLLDECIHFLSDLNQQVELRGHEGFDYMVSDAKSLSDFIIVMINDLKIIDKRYKEQKKVMGNTECGEHEHE